MADNYPSIMDAYGRRNNPYEPRRRLAQAMMQQGSDASPVQHPLQAASRLVQALVGGYMAGNVENEERDSIKKEREDLATKIADIGKITDPSARAAAVAAIDPRIGLQTMGNMAVEEAKLGRQQQGLNAVAGTYGAPQGPQQAGPVPGAPEGFANNVGNIRATNIGWQDKGQPHNGFETFATPQAGANAMYKNLSSYVRSNPNMTVGDAIAKWAPPNENNTQAYVARIAQAGIDPRAPLSAVLGNPDAATRLMMTMGAHEKGGLPPGFGPSTFAAAAGGGQAPPQIAQGDNVAAASPGMPPQPAAPGGPTVVAQPQAPALPQRVSVRDAPPQFLAPFIDRLRRGGYGTNAAEAEQKMLAHAQQELDRGFENNKLEYERQSKDFDYQRGRSDKAPQQQFDNSNKLRDEFNASPAVKAYRAVVPMLESAKDATTRPTRAADLNLVYAFAKLMDPDSVVRESETGAVVATQSVMDRVGSYVGQLNGQAMLNPAARAKLIDELQSRFTALESSYKTLEDHYGGMSDRFGLRREDVIVPIRKPASGNTPATSPEDLKKKYGLD